MIDNWIKIRLLSFSQFKNLVPDSFLNFNIYENLCLRL